MKPTAHLSTTIASLTTAAVVLLQFTPGRAQEPEPTFSYPAAGTQVTLIRDPRHVIVRYAREAGKAAKDRTPPGNFKVLRAHAREDCDMQVLEVPQGNEGGFQNAQFSHNAVAGLSKAGSLQSVDYAYVQPGSRGVIVPTRQLIIRLKTGNSLAQTLPDKANSAQFVKGTSDTFVVNYPEVSTDELLASLPGMASHPNVLWVEPNFVAHVRTDQAAPAVNDPNYLDQWHLNNTGQDGGNPGSDVGAVPAWDLLQGGGSPAVTIAVLDNGVQLDHPDIVIAQNLAELNGLPNVDDDLNGYPDDINGIRVRKPPVPGQPQVPIGVTNGGPDNESANHGTAVAGVAAATGNNGIGVAGLAYGTRILPIGMGESQGGALDVDDVGIAEAINYASARNSTGSWSGAQIINMSFSNPLPASVVSDALEWAAHSGRSGKGMAVCAASSNGGAHWITVTVPLNTWTRRINIMGAAWLGETIYLDDVEIPSVAIQGFEAAAYPPAPVQVLPVSDPASFGWSSNGWARLGSSTFPSVFTGTAAVRLVGTGTSDVTTGALSYVFPTIPAFTGGTMRIRFRVSSSDTFSGLSGYSGIKIVAEGTLPEGQSVQDQIWPPSNLPTSEASYFGSGLGATALGPIASHKDVIAVGASSNIDSPSFFSQSGSGLDFIAPGGSAIFGSTISEFATIQGVLTTDRTGADGYTGGDLVENLGTSFSSPLTAGAAALLLSKEPNLPGILVRDLLRAGCEKVGGAQYSYASDSPFGGSYNFDYGHGRLNVARSLQHLDQAVLLPPTPPTGVPWSLTELSVTDGRTWRFPTLGSYGFSAAGAFQWSGTSDRFGFANQLITGNSSIVARIGGVSGSTNQAVGGVMIRTANTASAPFVFVGLKRDGGIAFAKRSVSSGTVTWSDTLSSQSGPVWVRAVATGSSITASTSVNGISWTTAGSISGTFTGANVGLTGVNRDAFPAPLTQTHFTYDRVTVTGPLSIFTKAGTVAGYADGSVAQFNQPTGVCKDSDGVVYVADFGNHRIRKIATNGTVSTIAGTGTAGSFIGTTVASVAPLNGPKDLVLDSDGHLFILDAGNHCIRRLALATGSISTFAGLPTQSGFVGDGGLAVSAKFASPNGLTIDTDGNLYVADTGNHRIRRIDSVTGLIQSFAGGGSALGDNGPGTLAKLVGPLDVAADVSGNVYIADSGQFRIRKVTVGTGIISTIAGTGVAGYTGNNGAATAARVGTVNGVAVDTAGNVWFSDVYNASNHRVRRISMPSGIVSAVGGIGASGFTGDGASGVAARINAPYGLAVDIGGELIFADSANHRIRRIK